MAGRADWFVASLRSMKKEASDYRISSGLSLTIAALRVAEEYFVRGFAAGSSLPYTRRKPSGTVGSLKPIPPQAPTTKMWQLCETRCELVRRRW